MKRHPLPPPLSELEKRLRLPEGELSPEDEAAAQAALDDVAALILAEVPVTIAARWETRAPAAVTVVALRAARREFENPRGATSESVGGHFLTLGANGSSGAYLTEAELATVHREARGGPRGTRAGTVRIRASYE